MTRAEYNKYKDLIKLWAAGTKIEVYISSKWVDTQEPLWDEDTQYRIKVFKPKQGDKIKVYTFRDDKETDMGEAIFIEMTDNDLFRCIIEAEGEWQVVDGKILTSVYRYAKEIT